jgi:K+-sensing histidine kinase KdpD
MHLSKIINLVSGDIVKSINTILQLQEMTRILDVNLPVTINLCKTLHDVSRQFLTEIDSIQVPEFNITCPEELQLTTQAELFRSLLLNLFRYSVYYSMKDVENPWIRLNAGTKAGLVFLEFQDHSRYAYSELEETVFEPFALKDTEGETGGMEMFIAYSLIESGLSGDIDCFEDPSGHPYFLISFKGSVSELESEG